MSNITDMNGNPVTSDIDEGPSFPRYMVTYLDRSVNDDGTEAEYTHVVIIQGFLALEPTYLAVSQDPMSAELLIPVSRLISVRKIEDANTTTQ